MKINFFIVILALIGIVWLINFVSNITNQENIKINYVIPIPGGTIITEIDSTTLKNLETKFKQFYSQISFLGYEIPEASSFLVGFSIQCPNKKYDNITIKIEHSDLLDNILVGDSNNKPLKKLGKDYFEFQKDLFPMDITNLVIIGNTLVLNDEPYSGANIKIMIFSNNKEAFESKPHTIKVCKKDIEGGCSNRVKEIKDLFKKVFLTNITHNQTQTR